MKLVQAIILKLFGLSGLACGVLLLVFHVSQLYDRVIAYPPSAPLRVALGVVLILGSFLALVPSWLLAGRRGKAITFPSQHGNTTIQLSPVEHSLSRALKRLPEIRKIEVCLMPVEGGRKVRVEADVTIQRGSGVGARDLSAKLNDMICQHTKRVLGIDEVTSVELNITGGLGVGEDVASSGSLPGIGADTFSHDRAASRERTGRFWRAKPSPAEADGESEALHGEATVEDLPNRPSTLDEEDEEAEDRIS